MLICDICTQEVQSEDDMKSHLLLMHMEQEICCPFCPLSGLTYDELNFHIHTAHADTLYWTEDEQSQTQNVLDRTNITKSIQGHKDSQDSYSKNHQNNLAQSVKSNDPCGSSFSTKDNSAQSSLCNSVSVDEIYEVNDSEAVSRSSASVQLCGTEVLECPFCLKVKTSLEELEYHVRSEHVDLMGTPTKGDDGQYECPMCSLVCANCQTLEEHVNLHLEENSFDEGASAKNSMDRNLARQLQDEEDNQRRNEEFEREKNEFQKLQEQYGFDNSGGYKQQSLQNLERAVSRGRLQPMEFHLHRAQIMESLATGVDDGRTKTSGIVESLRRYYNSAHEVTRVWLCSQLDHFSNAAGDKGWGCGFRNFQMLLSSLLQNDSYNNCLQACRSVPCIPKLQAMIEDAWKEGFDPQGASHFNGKLQGTKAWIGACEIYCLLTSLQLKCRILDFHQPSSPFGTHPLLFDWVLKYYASGLPAGDKVICTPKSPIYLQHQGHSRTIIGIEERKNKNLCLLIFDPGCSSEKMKKLLRFDLDSAALKTLQKFAGNLKHKQYQIVAVEGELSPEEKAVRLQASKVFQAERIP
ncbi:hypothetical protein GDO86_009700 [Hymenochirus boettgeri]|uniref:Zinc finger-containing ubiquitin peptidase 1 n=1 Tax=Hymenochirus boettgeri TaxID=247094 RepID=A0A8T2JQD7_9PIPI|nr:hypothetical protein GDO86_009700 [Hymenochirus boettgeri]